MTLASPPILSIERIVSAEPIRLSISMTTISKLTNVQISNDQRIDEYYCENNDIRNEFDVDVDPLKDAHHINGID